MGLNDSQTKLAETRNGMIVVDAGPGTGKTKTIVQRYINIVSQPDVEMRDVLMLTFTNNAAKEMEERIKAGIAASGDPRLMKNANLVQARTFDSFCLAVVMDAPEAVSDFFGIDEKLTRSARMVENETVNREDFSRFLDGFLQDRGEDYGDAAIIASDEAGSLLSLINKLMSRGIVPLKGGWFGLGFERDLVGDTEWLIDQMAEVNERGRTSKLLNPLKDLADAGLPVDVDRKRVSPEEIEQAARGSRDELLRFIHDLYYAYIRHMVAENRLTFGLVALFAFTVLYNNESVRDNHRFRYVMIDEFQDTNANQLMMSLMVLSEPNLCAVGDWKQGIYSFRFVSIDNIVYFEDKVVQFRRFLNDDRTRVPFSIPEIQKMSLDVNYRSSALVIEKSFDTLYVRATKDEDVSPGGNVVMLEQGREDISGDTGARYCLADSKEAEPSLVARAIKDYVAGGYTIHDEDGPRPAGFGDITVLSRNTRDCRLILEACQSEGIPAYLFGDMPIMASREGKLALAWLRLVNNEQDPRGFVPILQDLGYTLIEIQSMYRTDPKGITVFEAPADIRKLRRDLRNKRRRISELLSAIFAIYSLDNDYTHAIISTVSSAHRGSLMTIADVIGMIEADIQDSNVYPVENPVSGGAVRIMTMHKSKGLEFPIVIIPFLDRARMPSSQTDKSVFRFHEKLGIRCTKRVFRTEGYSKIINDQDTAMCRTVINKDYDEDRRLFFVAVSRAKQYLTFIAADPSNFMTDISNGDYSEIPDRPLPRSALSQTLTPSPDIGGYAKRRIKLGVHEIMDFAAEDGTGGTAEGDEVCGKGKEYGTKVHELAYLLMRRGTLPERDFEEYPELARAKEVLDGLEGADLLEGEIDCGLPLGDPDVVLRGRIDLLAIYPDRVEIHDWKTDASDRFEPEYRLQLSVYAHAASSFYRKPAVCIIDYLGLGRSVRFDPMPLDTIRERTLARLK
ncbi:MAG: UvrD-helicase domain-containing protein [Candidatus Methanomethylophilaceae archaeon]|nr:UvrD-helicase domain-containing protein [Candidatus Methanomethylophilaceae archaeon]